MDENCRRVIDEVERIINLTPTEAAAESEEVRAFCKQIEAYKRLPALPLIVGVMISFSGLCSLNFSSSPYLLLKVFYVFIGLGSALLLAERSLGIFLARLEIKRLIEKRAVEFILKGRGGRKRGEEN
ncbi:MAG: hypothetical protein PHQ42_04390 [Patescibacteria group bacterium]|nr:hypothetical protein [Patescibacteria group bacterium]